LVANELGQARDAQLDHVLLVALLIAHDKVGVITQQLAQVGFACVTGAAHTKPAHSTATRWVEQDVVALPAPVNTTTTGSVSDKAHHHMYVYKELALRQAVAAFVFLCSMPLCLGCLFGVCCAPCCVLFGPKGTKWKR
jgi:hypothetical protein